MKEILTVTGLNNRIKELLEESFAYLWVEGEISNLRKPVSGHMYFTLKDENSQIRAVIFRAASLQKSWSLFELKEGMGVICRARLGVYQPRGEYQLIIDMVEPRGVGALQKAFEQLKTRLAAEGLFDPARKRPLPFLPRRIGVITSPTGAVIRDVLTVTSRRFPSVDILIAPARVQGEEAPAEIIDAITHLHAIGGIDVIIIARGGGSLEDLAPFNDERVARAIHGSRIPVISAVGHETDFTIADFVADLRAPTPSAAAELAVPMKRDLAAAIENLSMRLNGSHRRITERRRERITGAERRLGDPRRRIADLRMAVDDREERLKTVITNRQESHRHRLARMHLLLMHRSPSARIREYRSLMEQARKDIATKLRRFSERLRERVAGEMAVLESLSPLAVLARGYSITRSLPEGVIVRRADAVSVGATVDVRVGEGSFHARVTEIFKERTDGQGKI